MRKDMSEVIIERPRYGHSMGHGKGRYRSKLRTDPEHYPLKEPMWFRGNTKCLNENLAPLRRFLMSRVGRPWDLVWSEIRERLSPSSTVQKHVYDHVLQFVERNPIFIHGEPYSPLGHGPRRDQFFRLGGRFWDAFYVCPRTGLLRLAEKRRGKRKA